MCVCLFWPKIIIGKLLQCVGFHPVNTLRQDKLWNTNWLLTLGGCHGDQCLIGQIIEEDGRLTHALNAILNTTQKRLFEVIESWIQCWSSLDRRTYAQAAGSQCSHHQFLLRVDHGGQDVDAVSWEISSLFASFVDAVCPAGIEDLFTCVLVQQNQVSLQEAQEGGLLSSWAREWDN